jgi:hypothetical protein
MKHRFEPNVPGRRSDSYSAEPRSRLLLDEMFAPAVARALRDLGHDVTAVAEIQDLRAPSDADILRTAVDQGRWLVTENVKDFRPILLHMMQTETVVTGVLFTSSRSWPRSRKNPGPLIQALHTWLETGPPETPITEDWLVEPGGGQD